MTAINGRPSLAAIGPSSLYTQLTGKYQERSSLHQASYDVLLLREVFYEYVRNYWMSSFESFVRSHSDIVNIYHIKQSITKTRRRRKQNQIGLFYLNGFQ